MIRTCRPARTKSERKFIGKYIVPTGALPDEFGNYVLRIGADPVMWSCHTDTVHKNGGVQSVMIKDDYICLPRGSPSNCLGADCTTGVWLMLQMIKAGKEGLYIFHRDEEIGGKGSRFISEKTPKLLDGIKYAIAFDRFGTTSVITEQMAEKCASKEFAESIFPFLPQGYKVDDGGTFTDTANYTDLISECTNLSVGYYNQHMKTETQSISHMFQLRDAMLNLDVSKLVASRALDDKGDTWKYQSTYYSSAYYESRYGGQYTGGYEEEEHDSQNLDNLSMSRLVKQYPDDIADILEEQGYNVWEMVLEIKARRNL